MVAIILASAIPASATIKQVCNYQTCCSGTVTVDVTSPTTCLYSSTSDCPGSGVCDHSDLLVSYYEVVVEGGSGCGDTSRRVLVCESWVEQGSGAAVCGPYCSEKPVATDSTGYGKATGKTACTPGYAGTFRFQVSAQDNTDSSSCTCSSCGDNCCTNNCLVCCDQHAIAYSCWVTLN